MHKKAIAILGGMGPEASSYMYKLLIELAISQFGAKHNDDFPEITLYSVPVPDFISSEENKGAALRMLKRTVKSMDKELIGCISIACNTAHLLLDDLQKETPIPFCSMVDEVTKEIKKKKLRRVGLIGTPTTMRTKLYQSKLEKVGIDVILPKEHDYSKIEKIIRNVITGKITKKDEQTLKLLADELQSQKAEGILLGCTELPLVFPSIYVLPIFNSLEILSIAVLKKYYSQ